MRQTFDQGGARLAALRRTAVRALVVGSLAYGTVRPDSDLDLLIVAYPGWTWSGVNAVAASAARPYEPMANAHVWPAWPDVGILGG